MMVEISIIYRAETSSPYQLPCSSIMNLCIMYCIFNGEGQLVEGSSYRQEQQSARPYEGQPSCLGDDLPIIPDGPKHHTIIPYGPPIIPYGPNHHTI